jgi:adenylosuccinate synthase
LRWFDAVATRHATMVNGIDELAVTNIDGLDTVERIKVCVAYRVDGNLRNTCRQMLNCSPAAVPCTANFPAGRPARMKPRAGRICLPAVAPI